MLDLGSKTMVESSSGRWKLGPLELRVIRGFRDWIREQIGDPFATVERFFDRLPKEEQLARIKDAEAIAKQLDCFTMNSALAKEWMNTELGGAKLVHLLFQINHPDITEEQAFQIVQEKPEEVAQAITTSMGRMPSGNGEAPAS